MHAYIMYLCIYVYPYIIDDVRTHIHTRIRIFTAVSKLLLTSIFFFMFIDQTGSCCLYLDDET